MEKIRYDTITNANAYVFFFSRFESIENDTTANTLSDKVRYG